MSDLHKRLKAELPRLIRYSTALTGDADQALDLAEDTILEALADDQGAPSGVDFRVWLLTVLHQHRRNPFRQINPLAGSPHPEIDGAGMRSRSALQQALGRLPEEQRAALLLVGLEGLSHSETAEILRISPGAVRARLARGRENLRRAIGGATNASYRREAA
jgi:RNA polymerase sigma-70 factor, ECF subfamily